MHSSASLKSSINLGDAVMVSLSPHFTESVMVSLLRIYGSIALVFGYILIAGTPLKALGIGIRISGHLARLPFSFRYSLKDFIGFHGFFLVVEIPLLYQAFK
jgi:hypothetical protein